MTGSAHPHTDVLLPRIRYGDPYLVDLTPQQTRRMWRAMMLAPSLEVCEALLAGQDVPKNALDPTWRKRFGL